MKRLHPLLIGASALTLSACVVGPVYHAPIEAKVAVADADPAVVSTADAEPTWWRSFGDPELDGLIEAALRSQMTEV